MSRHRALTTRSISPDAVRNALLFLAPAPDHARREPGAEQQRVLARVLESLETRGDPDPQGARVREHHAELLECARAGAGIDREMGRVLRRFREIDGVKEMGFSRLGDYARERLGQSERWVQERIRLDRVFESFPALSAAHARGRVSASRCLELAPVMSEHNDRAWTACGADHTVRALRRLVRDARTRGLPAPPGYEHLVNTGVDPTPAPALGTVHPDEPLGQGRWVQLRAPAAVADLFDHTVDVARRLAGRHAAVHRSVEHVLAEFVASGPVDVDVDLEERADVVIDLADRAETIGELAAESRAEIAAGRRTPTSAAKTEPSRARATDESDKCDECDESDEVSREDVSREAAARVRPSASALDAELRRLLRMRHARLVAMGERLVAFHALGGWHDVGCASFTDYCRDALGISLRSAQELMRVQRRLGALPVLACAHREGTISWAKMRRLVTVAEPDTERAWLARACAVTVRSLEREVVSALRRRDTTPGGSVTEREPGVLTYVPPYASTSLVRPGAGLWEHAHTSARGVPETHTSACGVPTDEHPSGRDDLPCVVRFWLPESTHALWIAVDSTIARALGDRSAPWQRLVIVLRHFLEQWDTRSIERWSRGADTHRRFGWMCAVAGCTSRRNLEVHHIVFRSQNGALHVENEVSLCALHHRAALHDGASLRLEGTAPDGLRWTLPFGRYRGDVRISASRRSKLVQNHGAPPSVSSRRPVGVR